LKSWLKISVAVLVTAMICIPVAATVIGSDTKTLNVAGSTTVQPLMMELQKDFERYANVQMFVTGGGSGVGISSTLNGVADIGMLSRDLRANEGGGALKSHIIAMDAVVVIVNSSAGIDDLSMDSLVGIYSGAITNWSGGGIGGANIPIAVIAREEGSGTRDCFDAALKAHDSSFKIKETDINSVNSTGAVISAVENIPGSIGYINLDVSQKLHSDGITKVSVEGRTASSATVLSVDPSEKYGISRNLILVTNGDPEEMIKFFIEWILSTDGQDIVEKEGFVRIDGVTS
jgi:phosphate transport system substrate-binding protein